MGLYLMQQVAGPIIALGIRPNSFSICPGICLKFISEWK